MSRDEIRQYFIWGSVTSAIAGIAIGFGILTVMLFQVYFGDDSALRKTTILAKIQEETTIYMLDEETQVGSFFEDSHRRYVSIEEIPPHMINAIVASEDKYFYDHVGVNPIAIFKAIFEGIANGFRFRGGSTITQQTVKNIVDRREYSLKRKFNEAVAALQLERLYSKRQILEFYFNQFHVAGNGNGIGIAAQYYFNKDVRDLSLVESAFIAGSVKGPSKYNPFIKYTKEQRDKAIEYAFHRKNYVLKRMYEQGWIDQDEFETSWKEQVPFNRGEFRSQEVALVDLIRKQLKRKEILESLNMNSDDELNHAGLRIFTSLDQDMQHEGQLAMRQNLSRLETILTGFKTYEASDFQKLRDLKVDQYYYGKVLEVQNRNTPKPSIRIDFGLPKGTVPFDAIKRYAYWLDLPSGKGYQFHLKNLVDQIKKDDVIFVKVVEYDRESNEAQLELHTEPSINGGLIATDKGEVRAVISGFKKLGFNRAILARRQPGSVFKSVIYFAALQLGWSSLDRLDNERRMFPFQGQFYYPRGDHISPYKDVSMIWSGIMSENVATVYLTANLLEKLNLQQFKYLMNSMGLLPKEGELERDYHHRVARAIGVELDNDGLKEFQLRNAILDMKPDLIFSGDSKVLRTLSKMWWGRGYSTELQRLYSEELWEDAETAEDRRGRISGKEKLLRISLIKNNYQRLQTLSLSLNQDWARIKDALASASAESVMSDEEMRTIFSRFRVLDGDGARPELAYFRTFDNEINENTEVEVEVEPLEGRALNILDIQAIWGGITGYASGAGISLTEVKLSGFLPLKIFLKLQERVESRYQRISQIEEPYSISKYFHHHDFRVSLGLHFLVNLTKEMGVSAKLRPVLSFGLGTNEVSAADVAKIYQTFVDGKVYRFYDAGSNNQLNFIRRIEDRYGNLLFEPERKEHQLVAPEYAYQMREILRKIVTHGTGKRAHRELYLVPELGANSKKNMKIRIPAFGKTGTTNDFTTAYFAGFFPYPVEKAGALDPSNSYVLSSYVGYDLNKVMRNGRIKVYGGVGALPVWTDFAKATIRVKKYEEYLDTYDLNILTRKEWPVKFPELTEPQKVDLPRGVLLGRNASAKDDYIEMTDVAQEGERYENEFSINHSVKSVVYMPKSASSGPLRQFEIFRPYVEDEEAPEDGLVVNKEVVEGASWQMPSTVEQDTEDDSGVEVESNAGDLLKRYQSQIDQRKKEVEKHIADEEEIKRRAKEKLEKELEEEKLREAQAAEAGNQQKVKEDSTLDNEASEDPGYIEEELW